MLKNRTESELILFDRGYPGTKFFSFLKENNVEFLMRTKVNFSKDIKNAKQPDQIINIKNGKEVLTVRVVRFLLSSGIEEVLITSLLDKKYTLEDLKELYFKRWCVEVKYDELKNRLEIENLDRKSTRLNSSHANISYAVFCLKKKKHIRTRASVWPWYPSCCRRSACSCSRCTSLF